MKILVVPDKFKGCLTSLEAASLIGDVFQKRGHEIITSAIADGGEGTVEVVLSAVGGQKKSLPVSGPLGNTVDASWGLLKGGKEAVIEMAAASGLHLLKKSERDPFKATTIGTGQLIKAALDEGVEKIIIGLGGSASNDGGTGAARVLGARFINKDGSDLEGNGHNLDKIIDIDISNLDKRIADTQILVVADVENHFYGPEGAAFIYGPQKGAAGDQVKELDIGLRNLAAIIERKLFIDLQHISGAGAAGGLAGGLVAFLGAKITPGIELITELLGLESKMAQVDLVITGEGCADEQTLYGKAPSGVIKLAKKMEKKIIVISGQKGKGWERIEEAGAKVYALAKDATEAEECMKNPKPAIETAVEAILEEQDRQ